VVVVVGRELGVVARRDGIRAAKGGSQDWGASGESQEEAKAHARRIEAAILRAVSRAVCRSVW
jgi:hypothetical protein